MMGWSSVFYAKKDIEPVCLLRHMIVL
jgi:hypothetical protein